MSNHERLRLGLTEVDLQIDHRDVEVLQDAEGNLGFTWRGHRVTHPALSVAVNLAEPRDEEAERHLQDLKRLGARLLREEIEAMSHHQRLMLWARARQTDATSPDAD